MLVCGEPLETGTESWLCHEQVAPLTLPVPSWASVSALKSGLISQSLWADVIWLLSL